MSETGKKSCLLMVYAGMAWQMEDIVNVLHSKFLSVILNLVSYTVLIKKSGVSENHETDSITKKRKIKILRKSGKLIFNSESLSLVKQD